jgi:hypothetical protein
LVEEKKIFSFEDLYDYESRKLGKQVEGIDPIVAIGAGGEPWLCFTPQDRLGLALSGGGVRSATFNLGLLQALDQLGVLRQVDYLATVSGGGYIGGFWTAWLKRNKPAPGAAHLEAKVFPDSGDKASGEKPEIRHLREFSRFLLPCIKVLGSEFWGIVMTVLGGMVPSFLSALAVLVLAWFGWVVVLACLLAEHHRLECALVTLGFVALYFALSEYLWQKSLQNRSVGEPDEWEETGWIIGALLSCVVAMAGVYWLRHLIHSGKLPELAGKGLDVLKKPLEGFGPAMVFAGATLALFLLRFVIKRFVKSPKGVSLFGGCERALAQMLRLTVIIMALAALWWVAGELAQAALLKKAALVNWSAGTAFSTALFLWARKWLSDPPKETHGGNLLQLLVNKLKRATPKALALLSWLLLFVLVGVAVQMDVQGWIDQRNFWYWLLPGLGVVQLALMLFFFDPEGFGLHELYRSRISRCYLGASNQGVIVDGDTPAQRVEKNRSSTERQGDDLTMGDLAQVKRPLHLVCAAANDLSGDPVGTLYRGARSAVLSGHGISLGNQTAKLDELRFSSALTASAAAFNSQMGRISMGLGPAVTFLMSAFNLRLGLWVPHPSHSRRRPLLLPGRFFFLELLGLSNTMDKYLFLSDGGHFENFGLYELLRRHCRYIIVSDCGADLEVAFDDLANVLRRVREDFGVEVELDVSRLRPGANGLAGQHAVVGTIHYNGLGGMDKGTLLFIKPALTGDEPPDVLQYRTRNTTFPHESTANQFYDEPQWESYRRLGEHTGRVVLSFLDQPATKNSGSVDHIFREARSFWHPQPENLDDRFIQLSARSAELEENLTSEGPLQLRREFFFEAAELAKLEQAKVSPQENTQSTPSLEEELQVLGFLIRIIQIMEDVWVAGDFEQYWSHPLNEGWMNYFHRWANTASFRRWWPVVAPMYSPGLRAFVKDRFAVGSVDPSVDPQQEADRPTRTTARLHLTALESEAKYQDSHAWQCFRQYSPAGTSTLKGKTILGYELHLLNRAGETETASLWVGFVLIHESFKKHARVVEWHAEDFFVPPMLHGGKFVSNLLDALINHFQPGPGGKTVELKVCFCARGRKSSGASGPRKSQGLAPAARYEQVRKIEFYKSRGFQYRDYEQSEDDFSLYRDLVAPAPTHPPVAGPAKSP